LLKDVQALQCWTWSQSVDNIKVIFKFFKPQILKIIKIVWWLNDSCPAGGNWIYQFITCFSMVYKNISVKYKTDISLFERVKISIWYFYCFEFKPVTLFQWNTSLHSTGNQNYWLEVVKDVTLYYYLASFSFSLRFNYLFKHFFAYNKKKICFL
jgi:hypothetical protein